MPMTLGELAKHLNAELEGDANYGVSGVGSLQDAGPEEISFLGSSVYRRYLSATQAGAVILCRQDAEFYSGRCLIVTDPHLGFARVASILCPQIPTPPVVAPSADIHASATVPQSCSIGANAVIEEGVRLGEGCVVGAGAWIGQNVTMGDHNEVHANVSIYEGTQIGSNCRIYAGAVIGANGFGFAKDSEAWVPIPQLGAVVIGDKVSVGANTTIDRGALSDTVIENGVILDNQIHIAHNVIIGENTAMAGCVAVAGSTRIGKRCTFGGRAGVLDHLVIADDVHITATSLVTHSIHRQGVYSSVLPLAENRVWKKNAARMRSLDDNVRRIKILEKKIDILFSGSKK
ncbi:MAG TPA: UDP-3-O-(3-hydroxymyristoyl)glucosamine N-acyltransferase [Acidiferrobacteraceae bacterium]|nr:UDP-3-O-(3-hydroxymyristoyl)glucosamine N-acyltransferase [Acidiferrobacteraceae bacterium]